MNYTLPLEQIFETVYFDSNLIFRQYKLDLMARFMEINSLNPKFRQNQSPKDYVAHFLLYNDIDKIYIKIYICFHPTKSHQIVTKKNKRFQVQTLRIIHIVSVTSKDLKCPEKTSKD